MLDQHKGADGDCEPGQRQYSTTPIFSAKSPRRWLSFGHDAPYVHRTCNVFDRLLASVLITKSQLVPNLLINGARNANATGVCQALKSRGDIDPIAVNLWAINDNVAKVHPNSELHPPLGS